MTYIPGELADFGQVGREFEQYYETNMRKAREQWLEETNGDITFEQWLDGDCDPEEPSEEDEE